ncbi:hypothetical protein Tco_1337149 [Tanacetum coccineum]
MANLKYSDKHNMVAFLKKPNESVGFTEVVDFLKGTSLRYALTHNPTIYDSLVKQFWQTATVRTLANETQQLVASIDFKEYTITEAPVRSKLQLADATGIHNLSDAEIYVGLATLGYVTEGDFVPLLPAMLAGATMDQAPLPKGNTSGSAEASIQLKELMVLVPNLLTRVTSLEKELKETKQTLGNVVLKLVKKDVDDDPLVSLFRESMKEKSTDFVTPTKASGEAKEEEISPTILEAAKTLSKVTSQSVSKAKSTDKGKRYRRRARVEINTGIEDVNTGRVEKNSGIEDVNTGSTKVDTEDIQATHKTKEQIRQEEAGLEEAIRLQAQMDEEVSKQIHLDKMVAKRVQEEQDSQATTEKNEESLRLNLKADRRGLKALCPMETEARGKDELVKEEEAEVLVKKTGMKRKQKARKGINIAQTTQDEFNNEREAFVKDKVKDASSESEIGVDAIPTATKPPTIKYEANRPEEMYDRVFGVISRPYTLLTLDASTIYMLADRKYPLSKDACQVMLKMKLLDGTMDEVCYQLLKKIEKQAGIRK